MKVELAQLQSGGLEVINVEILQRIFVVKELQ